MIRKKLGDLDPNSITPREPKPAKGGDPKHTSMDTILLPQDKIRMERDSVGNRSSIMRTPDSSEIVGQSSTVVPDVEEIRAR